MVERFEMTSDEAATDASEQARPEWLPEKFQSPSDMAKAYGELERKLGSAEVSEDTSEATGEGEETPPELTLTKDTLKTYSDKFYTEGLTESDYAELEKMGVSKELVGQYAAGVSALQDQQTSSVLQVVGGEEQYNTMIEWAKESYSHSEIEAFNQAVSSGEQNTVMAAVKGLQGRYVASEGTEPTLVSGSTASSGEGSYDSVPQLVKAMSDPRYDTEPSYRREVMKKMENSHNL